MRPATFDDYNNHRSSAVIFVMIILLPTCSLDREDRCGNVVHQHVTAHRQRRINAEVDVSSDVDDRDMSIVHD